MAIAQIIKYEGDNSTFIWKHPCEDFNSLTQLIVHESQEAIFFMNGQALDLFGAGRYTLETQNIPKIGKALNRSTGDETPFHCEVYFINKTVQMALKWGTDSKVRYIDPDYGIPLELGASGSMNLQVENSRKLLVKLVGTMNGIAWDAEPSSFSKSIISCFRPMISTMVKSNLSQAIKAEQFDILEVDEHLESIGNVLHQKTLPGFEEYGLTVPQFYLSTVVLQEDDANFRRLKELHTISMQTRMARAEATVRTAQAQAEADVVAARRAIELEKQTTQTEVARLEAERKAEEKRVADEIAAAKRKKIKIIASAAATVCVAVLLLITTVIIPGSNYKKAVALMNSGEYEAAIAAFEELDGYKDSNEQAAMIIEQHPLAAPIGSIITFGVYEQDHDRNNGSEAIEWIVLDKTENSLLVISRYGLDAVPYNTEWTDVTWKTCSLRKWLNSTFLNSAFSDEEQAMISEVTVTADKNPKYSTKPGNETTDKVFLLSINEVEKYFSDDSSRMCAPTAYAKANGAWTSSDYTVGGAATCWWWLRSPGRDRYYAADVRNAGSVNDTGDRVNHDDLCVRPALWINPDS